MVFLCIGLYVLVGIIFTLTLITIEPMIAAAGWSLLILVLFWPYSLAKMVFGH